MSNFIVSRQVHSMDEFISQGPGRVGLFEFKLYKPFVQSNKVGKKMVIREFHMWRAEATPVGSEAKYTLVESSPAHLSVHLSNNMPRNFVIGPVANKMGQEPAVLVADPDWVKEGGVETFDVEIRQTNSIYPEITLFREEDIHSLRPYSTAHYFLIVVDYYY